MIVGVAVGEGYLNSDHGARCWGGGQYRRDVHGSERTRNAGSLDSATQRLRRTGDNGHGQGAHTGDSTSSGSEKSDQQVRGWGLTAAGRQDINHCDGGEVGWRQGGRHGPWDRSTLLGEDLTVFRGEMQDCHAHRGGERGSVRRQLSSRPLGRQHSRHR